MKMTKKLRQVVSVLAVGTALALTGSAARAQSSGVEGEVNCVDLKNVDTCGTCEYIRNVASERAYGCCSQSGKSYVYSGLASVNNCYNANSAPTQCKIVIYTFTEGECANV